MSIIGTHSLTWYCTEIATSNNVSYLNGLRAQLIGKFRDGSISLGIYQGLNRDIRDRSDWLKRIR